MNSHHPILAKNTRRLWTKTISEFEGKIILDLGCGRSKVPSSIGVDWSGQTDADVLCDLAHYPLPFHAFSADLIVCSHIVEHLEDIPGFMKELHRIGRDRSVVLIRTPHFTNASSWIDVTHRKHFSYRSFQYLFERILVPQGVYFRQTHIGLDYGGSVLQKLKQNICFIDLKFWEDNLAFIIPAKDLVFRLEILKS